MSVEAGLRVDMEVCYYSGREGQMSQDILSDLCLYLVLPYSDVWLWL